MYAYIWLDMWLYMAIYAYIVYFRCLDLYFVCLDLLNAVLGYSCTALISAFWSLCYRWLRIAYGYLHGPQFPLFVFGVTSLCDYCSSEVMSLNVGSQTILAFVFSIISVIFWMENWDSALLLCAFSHFCCCIPTLFALFPCPCLCMEDFCTKHPWPMTDKTKELLSRSASS